MQKTCWLVGKCFVQITEDLLYFVLETFIMQIFPVLSVAIYRISLFFMDKHFLHGKVTFLVVLLACGFRNIDETQ